MMTSVPGNAAGSIGVTDVSSTTAAIIDSVVKAEDLKKEDDCIIVSATSADDALFKQPVNVSDKWFSILDRELPLMSTEPMDEASLKEYKMSIANISCDSLFQTQGHPWEVQNVVPFFNVTLDECKVDPTKFVQECILSLSGIDEKQMETKLREYEQKMLIAANAAAEGTDADTVMASPADSKNCLESPRQRLKSEDAAESGDEEEEDEQKYESDCKPSTSAAAAAKSTTTPAIKTDAVKSEEHEEERAEEKKFLP